LIRNSRKKQSAISVSGSIHDLYPSANFTHRSSLGDQIQPARHSRAFYRRRFAWYMGDNKLYSLKASISPRLGIPDLRKNRRATAAEARAVGVT